VKPLLVHVGKASELEGALTELAREGWSLHAGWRPPRHGFAVTDARVVCHGAVLDRRDAAAAVLAGARGAGVVAAVGPTPGLVERVFEDLSRLGTVRTSAATEPVHGASATLLDRESINLLEALALGQTLEAAARSLSISRRTADRRLAAARRRLGVTTTAAALAKLASAPRPPIP
jgi:DNA-binding NarL/FixJ family response regulator